MNQPEPPPKLPEELKVELDRRWAAYLSNPTNVKTWEEIEERLRKSPTLPN